MTAGRDAEERRRRSDDHAPRFLVPAPTARGARGAVVAPHHLATQAGLAMLRADGSAVDAAIATNAALAVVAGSMCGLGGDAFWLIWDGEREHALNGSGRSARRATLEAAAAAAVDGRMPVRGPWSVTVPGAVSSWAEAHARFGRLPWRALLEPAVELADGFPASHAWRRTIEAGAGVYGVDSDWAAVYRPLARAWQVGQLVSLPALGRTLRRLGAEGPDSFYRGDLARRSAAYLRSRGSPLDETDFADHRSEWSLPIETDYRGLTATSHPPNSSGVVALQLLNILARFEPPARDAFSTRGVSDSRWIHLALDAARLTLAERDRLLTDPSLMAAGAVDEMLDPNRAAELAGRLDAERRLRRKELRSPAGGGTAYLAAADRWGGLVSVLQSNYAGFGSGLVDPNTGIAFQNRGAFFTLDPSHPNVLAPMKRTMHTLAPGMLLRQRRPWIAHGSMGGEIQPQLFAQFVSAVVDGGLDIASALAAPRWAADVTGHYGPASRTVLESRFAPHVAEELARRGHRVEWSEPFDLGMGHQHAIEVVEDPDGARTFAAATDPRSEGLPAAL